MNKVLPKTSPNATKGKLIVLVGSSGIGKSSICAQFPNPQFICDDKEIGISDLTDYGTVKLKNQPIFTSDWSSLLNETTLIIKKLKNNEIQLPATFVYESITGFEQQCFVHVCGAEFNNNWARSGAGFYNYSNGPKTCAKKYWPIFTRLLLDIKTLGGIVILTGHTHAKNTPNLHGDDYLTEQCYCDTDLWQNTHAVAEIVAFYTYELSTVVSGMRIKADADSLRRVLVCHKTPTHSGKNRLGINTKIECGNSPQYAYRNLCVTANLDPTTFQRKPKQ